jgi:hypothetical protein
VAKDWKPDKNRSVNQWNQPKTIFTTINSSSFYKKSISFPNITWNFKVVVAMPKRGARRAVRPARPCFLHQNALVWLGSTHHSLERYGGMGRCPTSAQKFGGRRKFRPERFHRFSENSEKISEIRENLAETHWRWRKNSRNPEYQNSAGFGDLSADFIDKSMIFSGIRCGDFRANFLEAGWILPKIDKWKEKTVENNDMTSTKFVHSLHPIWLTLSSVFCFAFSAS